MKKCVLGDVARSIQTGPFGSQLHQSDYTDCGTPVVMPKDVVNGDIVDTSIARVGPQHVSRLSRHQLRPGNLIFSRRGDVGRCALVKKEQNGWLCGTGCLRVVVDEEKINSSYLYYFLCQSDVAKWLESHAVGAIMLNINPSIVSQIPISFPTRGAQEQIANLLSALDRKIALNRRKIATLEKMAKEIYDYWFVQYDFPDANGRPYKSSGGEMVYSPELKREIPKGWKACSINDCGRFCRGVAYTRADERPQSENTVLVMRGNNISEGHIIDDSNRVYVDRDLVSVEQYLNKFEVLFAMSSGSKEHVGKAAIGYDYPRGAAFGAFCSKFVPEGKYRYVIYSFLASAAYRYFIKQVCAGTGINNLKSEHFDVPLLVFPQANELLDRFNAVCTPLYESIFVATQDIERMESLREFSLPLLMNGQVKLR